MRLPFARPRPNDARALSSALLLGLALCACTGRLVRNDPLDGASFDLRADHAVVDGLPPDALPPDGDAGSCGDGVCGAGETPTSCPADCVAGVWRPPPGTTWQWQLSGTIDTSIDVQMYDIDLFNAPVSMIAALQAAGRAVICYFSAGTYEDYRPDAGDFPGAVKGNKMDEWDELWLDVRAQAVRDIMKKRLDLAKSKGCDGVEPDNVDGYDNDSGFPLSSADQADYNKFLADEAHARGLSVGLKNDVAQVSQLQQYFDWALNEECITYDECGALSAFINAGKAVFHVEYKPASAAEVCPQTLPLKFSTLIKKLDLDAWYEACQ